MNNEEKILSLLETLASDMCAVKSDIVGMKSDISVLKFDVAIQKGGIGSLKAEQAKLAASQARIEEGQDKLDSDLSSFKESLELVKSTVVGIENNHGMKLDALFDGYQQLDEKLDRIEAHVTSQDEVILKRVFPKAADI